MRSPEVLRWSGEVARRSYRRSSLTGSQPSHMALMATAAGAGAQREDVALAAREEALRESEERARLEREEFERERAEWERERAEWEMEREKLLLEVKRLRLLQEAQATPSKDISLSTHLEPGEGPALELWSNQRSIPTLGATSPEKKEKEKKKKKKEEERRKERRAKKSEREERSDEEKDDKDKVVEEEEEEEEEEGKGEGSSALECEECQDKDEVIRKLERDLKRVKYLYYEANGKLMEGTMRDNKKHHGSPGSGLHRSDSAESAASMTATPRSRQLKETASLIFHEPTKSSKHRTSPRGSPLSPRVGPKS